MSIPLRQYWSLLAHYLRPYWRRLLALAALLLGASATQLATPQLIRAFLDGATTGAPLTSLLLLAGLVCIAGFASQALGVAETYVGAQLSWRATNDLRADLASHCLHLDLPFHYAHPPGELIERLDGDVRELRQFFSALAVQLLGNLLLACGVLALLLREDWRIGAVFVGFTLLTLWVFYRVRNAAAPFWQAAQEASAALYARLEEWLGGIIDLRTNGANQYVQRGFAAAVRAQFHSQRRAIATSVLVGNGAELLLVGGALAGFALSVSLFRAGAISLGTVYLVTAYASLLTSPLQEVIQQIDELQHASASIARIEALRSERPSVRSGATPLHSDGALDVTFANVAFRYPRVDVDAPAERVLDGVSFRLQAGQTLGLIGRTGSGKTTLTRLLLRLYDPSHGAITVNGSDIRQLRLDDLRRAIGVVTQDVQLFHASVRDNVTLFDHTIADGRILAAIQELALDTWLASLPHGLDTLLEPGGSGLSAGEAQLLAMVRVFLRDPQLVILDEATARLDPATERRIATSIERLLRPPSGPRTAILIAHRLRTVQRADTILLLDGGRVREYGLRAALAADPTSAFAQLLALGQEELPA